MSNYNRAKVLSSPKGENGTYAKCAKVLSSPKGENGTNAKCKHLHSLGKTAKKREREYGKLQRILLELTLPLPKIITKLPRAVFKLGPNHLSLLEFKTW